MSCRSTHYNLRHPWDICHVRRRPPPPSARLGYNSVLMAVAGVIPCPKKLDVVGCRLVHAVCWRCSRATFSPPRRGTGSRASPGRHLGSCRCWDKHPLSRLFLPRVCNIPVVVEDDGLPGAFSKYLSELQQNRKHGTCDNPDK